jgi:hypothetical protein
MPDVSISWQCATCDDDFDDNDWSARACCCREITDANENTWREIHDAADFRAA